MSTPNPSARPSDRPSTGSTEPTTKTAGQEFVRAASRRERLARRPRRRVGSRGVRELAEELSPRDVAVLDLVAEHRFLTTGQVQGFAFVDHATEDAAARSCRRVLARLERDDLIERPFRRVGGLMAGSSSSVWMLTQVGARVRGVLRGDGAVGRVRAPGERFVAHYLGIADARLSLVTAERAGQLRLLAAQIEPRSWRNFVGQHGVGMTLKPDLFAISTGPGAEEFEDHWFVEVDRGTESLPVLVRQCRNYEAYRRSLAGADVFPVIVWVVPSSRRAAKLCDVIAASRELTDELYRVCTPDQLVRVLTNPESTEYQPKRKEVT